MRAVADYVRTLADLLHLKDWRIVVDNEPPPTEPPALAAVKVTPGRKYAIVRFASDWYESAPEELRHTVTHELIHCHIAGMDQAVEGAADVFGLPAYNLFANGFNMALEHATDGLADAVAGFLPLPTIPPEPERVDDVIGSLGEEAEAVTYHPGAAPRTD